MIFLKTVSGWRAPPPATLDTVVLTALDLDTLATTIIN